MFLLENKVVLLTGGASGIGFCFATELLENNVKGLAIADIDRSGQSAVEKLKLQYGDRVIFIECDVGNGPKFESAFKKTAEVYNQLDIVINNAAILDEVNWPKMINVNLNGTIQGTTLAMDKYLPLYKEGEEGIVVNVASFLGIEYDDSIPFYTATKHAIVGLGRALGTEYHYKRSNVKVLTICPGITLTNLLRVNPHRSIEHVSQFTKMVRYKTQDPEDVGKVLIDVLKEGKNGSFWIIENGPPAYEIEFPSRQQMAKKTSDPIS